MDVKVGFLGAGKMAAALACGFAKAGLSSGSSMIASDPMEAAREQFKLATGSKVAASNGEVVDFAELIFLAVKPGQVTEVLKEVAPRWSAGKILASIAAGINLDRLEGCLPPGARVIRIMPNTPALVGASASAFASGKHAKPADAELVSKYLSAVGIAMQVKESLLDAVTGLSGSGPAYGYMIIEALSDGGVAAGLPRDISTKLAAQTLLGAARMVLETGQHPGALKDMVTSPGGTTIEGVHALEKGGLRAALINAVRAAADKSKLLGQASKEQAKL
jgi:pyrroline-5-carboxylate reductase